MLASNQLMNARTRQCHLSGSKEALIEPRFVGQQE